jgi:hypothetical protein
MDIGKYKQAMSYLLNPNATLKTFTLNPNAKLSDNDPQPIFGFEAGGRIGFKTGGDVQKWVQETYPDVNFDFKKYKNIGVGSSDKNYSMIKLAINKKLKNPDYVKPSLDKGINNIADAFLKSYAKDDVSYLTSKSEFNKNGMLSQGDVSFFNHKSKGPTFVQDIVDKTGLKAEDVLDLIDERENFIELDIKPEIAGQTKRGNTIQINKSIDQGEDWLIKNSKNYNTVEDLKKGFKRVFGKKHPFLRQTLSTVYGMPKLNPLFYEGKQKVYQMHGSPTFAYGAPEMKNLFQASLYNFNPTIRDEVLNELNDILPKTKITENQKYDLRKKFQNSKILSELGINKRLSGPVTRLLIKDLGENVVEDINFVRYPRTEVGHYINFLKDKVDPKYRKQFELVNKAIRQINYKNYNGAKDTLGIVENINLDHRVPKYLIDAGYADEIEYIKLNPIGEKFNMVAKNKNFDAPIARLSRKYEVTNNPEDKAKIIEEMNNLKDNFNKRYNNYLSDIDIKEVNGKLNVSSSLKPITSTDEFIKTLEKNVKENPEFFKLDGTFDKLVKNLNADVIPGLSALSETQALKSIGRLASGVSKATGTPFNAALGALLNTPEIRKKGIGTLDAAILGAGKGMTQDLANFLTYVARTPEALIKTFKEDPNTRKVRYEQFLENLGEEKYKFADELEDWYSNRINTKEYIDNLAQLEYEKELKKVMPAPSISETEMFDTDQYLNEELFKKKYREKLFKQFPEFKEEYNYVNKEPSVTPKGLYDVEITDLTQPQELAKGGRVGFAEGGGPKFTRRGALGLLGAIAATPLVKSLTKGEKFLEESKVAKVAKRIPKAAGMPEWFPSLVARIEKEGKDISIPVKNLEDMIVTKKLEIKVPGKKDPEIITMHKHPNGSIQIEADISGGSFDSPFELHYTPPKSDIDLATGKAINEPGDFNVLEQRPKTDWNGQMEIDYDYFSHEDAISDIERVEKIATGKRIHPKKVEQRTANRKLIENDPMEDVMNRSPGPPDTPDWWEQ